jgi:predicted outer membrane protein
MSRTGLLCVALAAIVIGGCSKTEGTKPEPAAVGTGGAGADLKNDDDFVRDVALKNMAEIELSRMALDKATGPDVKAFAQIMIEDHGAAGDKLKSVVSGQPIEWPAQLDDKHRETADELAKKQGADFDRDYVKAMVEGHQDLAAKLESRLDVRSLAEWKTAAAGRTESKALPEPKVDMRDVAVRPNKSDSDITMKINQWAADTYPVAQKHLDTARTLENATKKRSTN